MKARASLRTSKGFGSAVSFKTGGVWRPARTYPHIALGNNGLDYIAFRGGKWNPCFAVEDVIAENNSIIADFPGYGSMGVLELDPVESAIGRPVESIAFEYGIGRIMRAFRAIIVADDLIAIIDPVRLGMKIGASSGARIGWILNVRYPLPLRIHEKPDFCTRRVLLIKANCLARIADIGEFALPGYGRSFENPEMTVRFTNERIFFFGIIQCAKSDYLAPAVHSCRTQKRYVPSFNLAIPGIDVVRA